MSVCGWSRMSALCCVRALPTRSGPQHQAGHCAEPGYGIGSAIDRGGRKLANETRRGSHIWLRLEDEPLILVFLLGSPNLQAYATFAPSEFAFSTRASASTACCTVESPTSGYMWTVSFCSIENVSKTASSFMRTSSTGYPAASAQSYWHSSCWRHQSQPQQKQNGAEKE